jgi:ubiquinone/menaquinone biosynthesis C-methylase UbiE
MSDLSQFQHPRFAQMYERISADSERRGTAGCRDRVLAGLAGRVIEVGAGNGMNFAHYPQAVSEVVAVEPEDQLRALAADAASHAAVSVSVVAGHADDLPYEEASFDAGVASLVLCSVLDPRRSLAELHRVIRPGGELRFFEHVRSARPLIGAFQDLVTPVWSRAAGGCHLNRDLAADISAAGFEVVRLDRFSYRPLRLIPAHAHILGTARRPG